MITRKNAAITAYTLSVLLVNIAIGCKKTEVVPGNGQEAYLNFYNASEVQQQNIALALSNHVVIDKQYTINGMGAFGADGDNRQFPHTPGIAQMTPDNLNLPIGITYNHVFWLPMMSGSHHLAYTSDDRKITLQAITETLQPKAFNMQYFVESPVADSLYNIFSFPVQQAGTPGKVRVQIVHLSPDLGPIEVYRADENGNKVDTDLPNTLVYGQGSSSIEIDTVGSSKTKQLILLKFLKKGSSDIALTSSIPAVSNSSFIVVLRGFEQSTVRKIKMKSGYQTVTVNSNIRTNLRRIF